MEAGKQDGKRRRVARRGFSTKREAQEKAKEIEKILDGFGPIKPSALSLGEWLDHWLATRKSEGLKASTLASYGAVIDSRIAPRIGSIRLRDVTPLDIQRFYVDLLTQGLSTGSARNTHTLLHKALADAVDQRLIPRNPAKGAFTTRVKRKEMRGWTHDELVVFLEAAARTRLYPLMRLAAMTGMRRAEVIGLRWLDVDLKAEVDHDETSIVHVRKTLTKANDGPELEDPKSRRGVRALELDAGTSSALAGWRQAQRQEAMAFGRASFQQNNPHRLVFTRVDGAALHPDVVSHTFLDIAKAADLPRIRFHDLRRTHGSLLLGQGEALHVVSRRLGHASAAFTADVYADVLPGQAGDAVAQLANSLKSKTKASPSP